MKIDEDVRMISSEAPLLFAKAAQIFITELIQNTKYHKMAFILGVCKKLPTSRR